MGKRLPSILPKVATSTSLWVLLHAVNLRHGTDGFTSLPKEGALRIFFLPKNPKASAGFEPANLGTKGQHAHFQTTEAAKFTHPDVSKCKNQQIYPSYTPHSCWLQKYILCSTIIIFFLRSLVLSEVGWHFVKKCG